MNPLSLAATRIAISDATRHASLYTIFDAIHTAIYDATSRATRIPDHPTTDHITALLERAKEAAR